MSEESTQETTPTGHAAMFADTAFWLGLGLVMVVEASKLGTVRLILGGLAAVVIFEVGTSVYPLARGTQWLAMKSRRVRE